MSLKFITLCADDFGLNTEVSEAILELVTLNRLSAVSCMTNMPHFNMYAKELFRWNKVYTGLHFNLTEGFLLSSPDKSCFSLKELMLKAHLQLISAEIIAGELNAQLDHYIQYKGDLPDFIDGHQHIHQIPLIRKVVLQIYEERLRKKGTFIRATYPAISLPEYTLKAKIIASTGGRALARALKRYKIPHNPYFSGIYNFAPGTDYRSLFVQWLSKVPSDTLIMCHPGKEQPNDCIAHARMCEMDYFLSDGFLNDCLDHKVSLKTNPN